jgi:hypothetical protein
LDQANDKGDNTLKLKSKLLAGASSLVMASSLMAVAAPSAHAVVTHVGDCGGAVGFYKLTSAVKGQGLGDQTAYVKVAGNLAKDQTSKLAVNGGGSCSGKVRPGDTHVPQPPAFVTGKSQAVVLTGNGTCATGDGVDDDANAANAWPINGKITWTFNETYTDMISLGIKPYKMQADVAILGFNPGFLDVVDVGGITLSGINVGTQVSGQIWEDPVAKTGGASGFNTGYELDLLSAAGCADNTPGNANILQVLSGGGNLNGDDSSTSLLGSVGVSGLSFDAGEA